MLTNKHISAVPIKVYPINAFISILSLKSVRHNKHIEP